jgi:hypothetical protein
MRFTIVAASEPVLPIEMNTEESAAPSAAVTPSARLAPAPPDAKKSSISGAFTVELSDKKLIASVAVLASAVVSSIAF